MRIPLTLIFAASIASYSLPAAADDIVLNLEPAKPEVMRSPTYVEAHDVLLLDVSGSMDDAEIIAMFDGAGAYYTSKEAIINYEAGICTAVTAVFYGSRAYAKPTYTICSEEDARHFVADNVDLSQIDLMQTMAGTYATYLREGLDQAIVIFDRNDVETVRRRVVVVGDESGGTVDLLKPPAVMLYSHYGATVSAVAIGSGGAGVQDAFMRSIVTPPDATFWDVQYDGTPYEMRVQPGMAYIAKDPAELSAQLQLALALGAG